MRDPLDPNHYASNAISTAQALLGYTLARTLDTGETLRGIIIETEAYTGPEDQCSHAKNGHRSPRNESMWAKPGTAYVYFTYGMHHCFNVSCYEPDHPAAVLVRALAPTEGLETMRANRTSPRRTTPIPDSDLCSGPGKLCQALRIDLDLDAEDLTTSERIRIEPGVPIPDHAVDNTPRIGVGTRDWAQKPLRWVVRKGWVEQRMRS